MSTFSYLKKIIVILVKFKQTRNNRIHALLFIKILKSNKFWNLDFQIHLFPSHTGHDIFLNISSLALVPQFLRKKWNIICTSFLDLFNLNMTGKSWRSHNFAIVGFLCWQGKKKLARANAINLNSLVPLHTCNDIENHEEIYKRNKWNNGKNTQRRTYNSVRR